MSVAGSITKVVAGAADAVAGTVAKTVAPLIPESVYGTMGKQFINIICDTLYHGSNELKLHPKEEILKIIEEQLKRGLNENAEQINKRMNEVIAEETRKYMQPFLSNNTISVYMMKDILTKHFDLCVSIIQKAKSSIHKKNTKVDDKVNAMMEQLTKPILNVSIQKGGSDPQFISSDQSETKYKPIDKVTDTPIDKVTPSVPSVSDSSFEKLAQESVSIFKEKMDKHVSGEAINDVIINGLQYHIDKPEGRQMFLRQIEPVLRSYALEYTNKGQSLAILFSHLCSVEPIHSIMKNNLTDYANNKVVDARIACNKIKIAMNTNISLVNPLNGVYEDMKTYFTKPQIIEKMYDDSNKTICTGTQQLKNAITGNDEISADPVLVSNIEEEKLRADWRKYIENTDNRVITLNEYKQFKKSNIPDSDIKEAKLHDDWEAYRKNEESGQNVLSFDEYKQMVEQLTKSNIPDSDIKGTDNTNNETKKTTTPKDTKDLMSVGVLSVAFSPNGKQIVSGSINGKIELWDIATGKKKIFTTSRVNSVAFSPNENQIVSGLNNKTIELWDIATDKVIKTFDGHTDFVTSVAFSPDGSKIVSGSYDHTIKLWDIATAKVIKTFDGDNGIVYSVAFSPDGSKIVSSSSDKIVSGSFDNTIKLWDISTDKVIQTFKGHTSRITSVAFSPDGSKIVSGSFDKTIKLWDIAKGEAIQTLNGHTDHVNSVAFSPDGSKIVSGSSDKTIKLWDIASGVVIQTINNIHNDRVNSVAFSPDGSKIVSGSSDNTVKISDVPPQKGGKPKRVSKTKRRRRTFRKRNTTQRHL